MDTILTNLDRASYVDSVAGIENTECKRFADQALAWWDRHFSWNAQGCDVLTNDEDEHLSYMFSKTDRYGEYLTIYNLFTPVEERRKGYAEELLRLIMDRAAENHVRRISFSSVSSSLDFYLDLGFVFWGLNDIGDYHCDLPIPDLGLDGMETMTRSTDVQQLIGKKMDNIYAKVNGNEENLTLSQSLRYDDDRIKLGERCKYKALLKIKEQLQY